MPLIVNSTEAEAQTRLTAIRLVSLTLRLMEKWRHLVGDHDGAMIMMAVAVINTECLTGKKLSEQNVADLRKPVPPEMLRRCNISSVSLATGLNRETTRRKVGRLVERGFLAKRANGHIYLHPELVIREEIVEAMRSQLDTFAKTANALLHDGTIRFSTMMIGEPQSDDCQDMRFRLSGGSEA